jgi:hypothetical protein
MIGVVGKQKSVEMPSRFRISAITSMTSIDGSSQRSFGLGQRTAPADGGSLALARGQCQPAATGWLISLLVDPAEMTGGLAPGAMLGADCLWRSARAARTITHVQQPLFRRRS